MYPGRHFLSSHLTTSVQISYEMIEPWVYGDERAPTAAMAYYKRKKGTRDGDWKGGVTQRHLRYQ